MMTSEHSKFLGFIVCIPILTRIVAEAVNTFFWDRTNYLWSGLVMIFLTLVVLPLFIFIKRRDSFVLVDFWPIFIYLAFSLFRIKLDLFYSIKCFFSELIVWSIFIFTVTVCSKDRKAADFLKKMIIWIAKILVIIGLLQLMIYVFNSKSLSLTDYLEFRPIQSVFIHQSICLIMLLPFMFYFIKQRSYIWVMLVFFVCLGTGTRSPFLALSLMSLLVMKSAFRWEIKWRDILLTVLVIILVYGSLIKMNSYGWSYENVDSRFSFGTLQWRVEFWRMFLNDTKGLAIIIGNGLGTADYLAQGHITGLTYPPHNDYVRVFYDQGIIGLILYFNMIIFMFRLILRAKNAENDFLLIIYLMILCFSITDNFLYVTNTVLIYSFFAVFIGRDAFKESRERGLEFKAAETVTA